MEAPSCEYIKTGGARCGSPAIKDRPFCYYHERLKMHMPMTEMFVDQIKNPKPGELPVAVFDLPFLDDGAAVQIGYMQVIHGITHRRLNPRQAGLMLSALHGAARNLRQMDKAVDAGARFLASLVAKKQPQSVGTSGVAAKNPGAKTS